MNLLALCGRRRKKETAVENVRLFQQGKPQKVVNSEYFH